MKKPPAISVLMSVYNESPQHLKEAIESILGQNFIDFEFIIVIDNPDNLEVKNIIKEYQKNDNRIKTIENEKNLGLAKSLNVAFRFASGELIARMDADDISLENRFEEQVDFLKKNSHISLVGSWVHKIDERGNIFGIMKFPSSHQILQKLLKYKMPIMHPSWMFRRSLFDNLNGYRNIPCAEDYDFLLRASENNFLFSNIDKPLLKYRFRIDKISHKYALEQLKISYYLLQLHEKRLKTGEDHFDEKDLNIFFQSSKLESLTYLISYIFFLKAMRLKGGKFFFISIPFLFFSFIFAPKWGGRRIYRGIMASLVKK